MKEPRIGIVGVTHPEGRELARGIEAVLDGFAHVLISRTLVPRHRLGTNVLTLVVHASTDEIGALAGKLGMLEGVRVRSLVI